MDGLGDMDLEKMMGGAAPDMSDEDDDYELVYEDLEVDEEKDVSRLSNGGVTEVETGTARTNTFAGLAPGESYTFEVRALLLGEYLGMEKLLADVKARTYANLHHQEDGMPHGTAPLAAAFDAELGSLQDAIDRQVLPARFFGPAPQPPLPPERTVKALVPAPLGYTVLFTNGAIDLGRAMDDGELDSDCEETGNKTLGTLIQVCTTEWKKEKTYRTECDDISGDLTPRCAAARLGAGTGGQ